MRYMWQDSEKYFCCDVDRDFLYLCRLLHSLPTLPTPRLFHLEKLSNPPAYKAPRLFGTQELLNTAFHSITLRVVEFSRIDAEEFQVLDTDK